MTATRKRSIWIAIIVIYIACVCAAYALNVDLLLFALTLPFSTVISFFSPLLIHMSSIDLNNYLLFGAVVNGLLLLRFGAFGYID